MADDEAPHREKVSAALPSEAIGERPGPAAQLMRVLSAALSGGLLVLMVFVIIPQLSSLDAVWAAMSSMTWETIILLVIVALVIRGLLAEAYVPLIPGLS